MPPSPPVDIAVGITLLFGTSGFVAEILDVTPPNTTRDSIDVSHQGTTPAKVFTPADLYDSGEASFDFHFNPDTNPPIDQPAEAVTMTFPSGAIWAFEAFMTDYAPDAPLNDKMVGSATLKVSDEITITPVA